MHFQSKRERLYMSDRFENDETDDLPDAQDAEEGDEAVDEEAKAYFERYRESGPEVEEEKSILFLFNGAQMSLYDFKAGIMNYDESATAADLQKWSAALRALKPGQSLNLKEVGGEGVATRIAVT